MGRRCSHCGNNGHNSRTCSSYRSTAGGGGGGGLRLFGVQLQMDASTMKKSFSLECLPSSSAAAAAAAATAVGGAYPSSAPSFPSSSSPSSSSSSLASIEEAADKVASGYLSDGLMGRAQERKKGVPWTEEEHRTFLVGLEKLGKGDWRGISRYFVTSRTPTQVASHAQKYFLRQTSLTKKKKCRSSLFDVVGSCGGGSAQHSRGKDPAASRAPHASPALSLLTAGTGSNTCREIDLNTAEEVTQLASCPPQQPAPPSLPSELISGALSQPSGMVSVQVPLHLPNLELTISSPVLDQSGSPPASAFFAKGVTVT
ncbi:hypothetical protein Taro_012900 [Colocasia esculenta]|uniref:Uncharacterized protein n=1 Tax=Colocasia esculenta TaxID=4460 RepID=A0A843UAH2_COLES|nr:hypothetical protein [Colocasia esculenta]